MQSPSNQPCKYCPLCGQRLALHMIHCGKCHAAQPVSPHPAPSDAPPPFVATSPSFGPLSLPQTTLAGVVAAICLFLLIGFWTCVGLLPRSFSASSAAMKAKLHSGQSVAEVEELLGTPSRSQDMDGNYLRLQMLYYDASDGMVQIVFQNGRLTGVNKY